MAAPRQDARRIAHALTRLFQAARLYAPGHQLRGRRRVELAEALDTAAERDEAVELDVRGLTLTVGREDRYSLVDEPCRELASASEQAGLRRVILPVHEGLQRAEDLIDLLVAGRSREGGQQTKPVVAARGEDTRDPLDDLLLDALPPFAQESADTPERPICEDPASLTGRLETIWRGVVLTRQLDPDRLHELGRDLSERPGDAHLEPVRLVPGSDPREAMLAQAINAARLFWLCLQTQPIPAEERLRLLEASLLTDVGMLAVPAEVISHEGRLEPAALEIIARHPLEGARMLMATPGAPLVAGVLAFEHHMRRAGRGYPRAHGWVVGPLTALFQVCDTYAALRSERAYRKAFSEDEARALVRRMADVWLDGRWVALLFDGAAPEGAAAEDLGEELVELPVEPETARV